MRAALATLLCLPSFAFAQENDGFSFGLGVGARAQPNYFGSDEYGARPIPGFNFERLKFGSLDLGGEQKLGFGFGPSFRIIGPREADDFDELTGLEDVELSVEIGGGLEFNAPDYELYANLRYGVLGHESLVAEVGGDVIYRPTEQVTLSAGPRILWGSDDYAQP